MPCSARSSLNTIQSSNNVEVVNFGLIGPDGVEVSPKSFEVSPNSQEIIQVKIASRELPPGKYDVNLFFDCRDGLVVDNLIDEPISFVIQQRTFWEKYGLWLTAVSIASLAAGWRIKLRSQTLTRPKGVLTSIQTPPGKPVSAISVSLASRSQGLFEKKVLIGNEKKCGVRLQSSDIRSIHATIKPIKTTEFERIGKPARSVKVTKIRNTITNVGGGKVLVNQTPIKKGEVSFPLADGAKIQFGEWVFVYEESQRFWGR